VEEAVVDLLRDEVSMLVLGPTDWGGPIEATESLAAEMGFSSLDDLDENGERIAAAIAAGESLSVEDWSRALLAAVYAFALEGDEWTVVQGGTHGYWDGILQRLRSKVRIEPRPS
jgi:hypothetical protein